MTPEEAKIILTTYRAGELDAGDTSAREALELAAQNPEVAAWWESEQAFDRVFSRKLASISLPLELSETIMRGGATIFFARGLIAQTTGERAEEAPDPIVEAQAEEAAAQQAAELENEATESEKRAAGLRHHTWWWTLLLPFSLAVGLILTVLGVFLYLDAQKLSAKTEAELPAFTQYAARIANGNLPPMAASANLPDLQSFLDAHHAPNPSALPARIGSVTMVGVLVEEWNLHPVAYYILQTDQSQIHLFILNRSEFNHDSVSEQSNESSEGTMAVTTWSEGQNIFILLHPMPESKPPSVFLKH